VSERELLVRLAVAALGGLAVGVEREWSARHEQVPPRFAGVRTFLLFGLLGGLSAVVGDAVGWSAGALPLAGGVALAAIAYFVAARRGRADATTEVAGLLVLAAGLVAGLGMLVIASAVFAVTALVLVEKGPMHGAVERIRSEELEAAARFAVLALVVLPLLPTTPIPALGGLVPRRLWEIVLLFAGLSFAGYVALRVAGPRRGYGVAGILGGVVSSTAVTLNFARESRRAPGAAGPLALGALAASAVLPVRVAVVTAILHAPTARVLAPALLLPLGFAAATVALAFRSRRDEPLLGEHLIPAHPLRLGAAIQMALLFALVLAVLATVRDRIGSQGLLAGSAVLGLTDLDALTYTMSRLAAAGTPEVLAARGLIVGMLTNSLFKAGAAMVLGAPEFRRKCGSGLLLYVALFAASWALL
jgi:uncharacterized membrane protein (DUF4010 family)